MLSSLQAQFDSLKQNQDKGLLILIDPDKPPTDLPAFLRQAEGVGARAILVGGSLTLGSEIQQLVPTIKAHTALPVILFPGSSHQVTPAADGILLLSLISGRNPDLLIGRHVEAAPLIEAAKLQVLPTGYMLIEAGNYTTVNYISQTMPIPRNKAQIAMSTALAGQQLGLKLIYLDGGSGAKWTVPAEMIQAVAGVVKIPVIVGGGMRSAADVYQAWMAGADLVVVGTVLEGEGASTFFEELHAFSEEI